MGLLIGGAIAVAQDTDPLQGNWEGKFTQKAWKDKPVSAKVVAQGKGGYRAILAVPAGDGKSVEVAMTGAMEKDEVGLSGAGDLGAAVGGACEVKAKIKGGKVTGKISGRNAPGEFEMARIEKKPPTLGA